MMADGYSASEAAEDYPRCVELCQQSQPASEVAAALIRTWSYYAFRGDLDDADRVLSVTVDTVAAAGLSFPAQEMGQGVVDFFRGRYQHSGEQLSQFAARASVASEGRPPGIWPLPNDPLAAVQAHLAALLWITGEVDQSARMGDPGTRAVKRARVSLRPVQPVLRQLPSRCGTQHRWGSSRIG